MVFVSQSSDRQEEGAHKEANECVYGLGSSCTSCHVKTVSESSELRAQQISGKAVEVSDSKHRLIRGKVV